MEKQYKEKEKLKRNITKWINNLIMIILIFHIFYFIIEMNDAEKKKYEEELQTMKEKQKKHEPVSYKYI